MNSFLIKEGLALAGRVDAAGADDI